MPGLTKLRVANGQHTFSSDTCFLIVYIQDNLYQIAGIVINKLIIM